VSSRICASQQEHDEFYSKLRITPCPHCNKVGNLIRHGFLRGYNEERPPKKMIRAARVFCSNRNRASGCGRTFSLWMATQIRRLTLSAQSLWTFLLDALSIGNKRQAFARLNSSLSDSAPYRIWKRFQKAQSAIRTALTSFCEPPTGPADGNPGCETKNGDAADQGEISASLTDFDPVCITDREAPRKGPSS